MAVVGKLIPFSGGVESFSRSIVGPRKTSGNDDDSIESIGKVLRYV